MLEVARVDSGDVVYDLGCGDGRIVIAAARDRGARGVCVDIDQALVAQSRLNADTAGVADRIEFRHADMFETDLHSATMVALYLSPALNVRLRPKLFREVRPGTWIVSHDFDMGDWKPDTTVRVTWPAGTTSAVHAWRLPADVAGTWEVVVSGGAGERRFRVGFDQQYQQLSGSGIGRGAHHDSRRGAAAGRQCGVRACGPNRRPAGPAPAGGTSLGLGDDGDGVDRREHRGHQLAGGAALRDG